MIVIDTSVAVKLINVQETDSDKANLLLTHHLEGKEKITVPSLLFLELANALVTKSSLSAQVIEESMKLLNSYGFIVHSFTKDDLMEATRLAKHYDTTVYDMLYAVVAQAERSNLITADVKFAKKTKFSYVKLLSELGEN